MQENQEDLQTILGDFRRELTRRGRDRASLAPLPMINGESMLGDLDLPYSSMPKLRTTQWKNTQSTL
jgi:hypothetical protein